MATMISYAQNREDVLLGRVFPPDYVGFYVDVGANHPVNDSVTKHFYDRGWSGVNVEPAAVFERLRQERPRDVNLNVAVSRTPGHATLFDYPTASAHATLSPVVARDNNRFLSLCVPREVEVITLTQLCQQHVKGRTIDFMSIDVEGHESEVIAGGEWRQFRPRVLLVESTFPHSTQPSHRGWEPLLLGHDYRFALFDGLNRFYVRGEDADLLPHLASPVCVFDDYITVADHAYQTLLAWQAALYARPSVRLARFLRKTVCVLPFARRHAPSARAG